MERCRTSGPLLLGIVVSSGWAAAGSLEKLDAEYGFLNYPFGDRLEEYRNMAEVRDDGTFRLFVRRVDRRSFLGIPVAGIAYGFHGDRLFGVAFKPWRREGTAALRLELVEAYGEPVASPFGERWEGERVWLEWWSASDGRPTVVFLERETVERARERGAEPRRIFRHLD